MSISHLIETYGYRAVFLLVGAESLGIPLPGETAHILAGTYAGHTHRLSPWLIFLVAAAAAIIGDNIGYWIGDNGGCRLARRYGPKVRLDEHKLKIARYLFDRYGDRVVFFGRFVSVLRTYAAFLAGPPYRPAPYRQVSRIEPSTLIPRSTLSTVADHLADRRVAHHPTEDTHRPTPSQPHPVPHPCRVSQMCD